MPQHTCASQRRTLWNGFSHSTFTRAPVIELRLPGLIKSLYPLSHLTGPRLAPSPWPPPHSTCIGGQKQPKFYGAQELPESH